MQDIFFQVTLSSLQCYFSIIGILIIFNQFLYSYIIFYYFDRQGSTTTEHVFMVGSVWCIVSLFPYKFRPLLTIWRRGASSMSSRGAKPCYILSIWRYNSRRQDHTWKRNGRANYQQLGSLHTLVRTYFWLSSFPGERDVGEAPRCVHIN
jgi:hypothetical protein